MPIVVAMTAYSMQNDKNVSWKMGWTLIFQGSIIIAEDL
jgi:hypothetical protein